MPLELARHQPDDANLLIGYSKAVIAAVDAVAPAVVRRFAFGWEATPADAPLTPAL